MSKERFFFGTRKSDNKKIYLTKPSWDCGWYWSFGYLGNSREHYHLDSYRTVNHYLKLEDGSHKSITEQRNKCMYDCLLEDYTLKKNLLGEKNKFGSYPKLWTFCELFTTAYSLKETAEVLGRGGSHVTDNPVADVIKNEDEVKRINEVVLPAIFKEIETLING